MAKSKKQRYGIFYKSHGKWTGPYGGVTFTKHTLARKDSQYDLNWIKNYVLKTRIKLRPVVS